MKLNGKMPWWLVVVTGALIIAAGIFLLAANTPIDNRNTAISTINVIVSILVLAYGLYNFYKAYKLKEIRKLFIAHLVHGILDIVLFILLCFRGSHVWLGVILACWFIIFGLFGLVETDQSSAKNRQNRRINILLLVIGIALLVIPLLLNINYITLLGICSIIIGIVRTVQGILMKTHYDERTSGGRSNLY